MTLSKEDVATIKQELTENYGWVYLNCDGYAVLANIEKSKMKLVVAVYVNGYIKGTDCFHGKESELATMGEISKRFYCLKKKSFYTAKQKAKMIRIFGKKRYEQDNVFNYFYYTYPYFTTVGSFITHIKKHNASIELINKDDYEAMIYALPREAANG
ncbi:MAG: hypothetical protein WCG16_13080 [Methylococcales bacterium]